MRVQGRQFPSHDVHASRRALVEEWQALPQNGIVCLIRSRPKQCRDCVNTRVAIPAADLTINSVILFERAKVIAFALVHLCFGGESPLNYVKNKVWLNNLWPHLPRQAK